MSGNLHSPRAFFRALLFVLGFASLPALALDVQEWHTEEGARVLYVAAPDLPMLDVRLAFPGGSGFDPAGKSGLAALTQDMLGLGSAQYDEKAISDRTADVGAVFGGSVDRDMATMSLRSLSSEAELKTAVDVFADTLAAPTFPEEILAREKARMSAAIKDALTRPDEIADRAFYAAMYPNHPYGKPGGGEVADIDKLSREDVVDFYRRHYRADQAAVVIIGDISLDRAKALAARLVKPLRREGTPAEIPPVPEPGKGSISYTPHPASQSHILIGMPAVKRGDPDYFALMVGNYILGGGGFSSRLLTEVREKHGLAYSAYSYFAPMKQAGPFVIGLETAKDQTEAALKVVDDVLGRFLAKGPSAQEVREAKEHLIVSFPLRYDSNAKIAGLLTMIGYYGLPADYLDQWVARIREVKMEDIRRAFASHVDRERLATVVVGAAKP